MNMKIGSLPHGAGNRITDVPGVRVGHCTVDEGTCHTGVTVVLPPGENPFRNKMTAACQVFNGFGNTMRNGASGAVFVMCAQIIDYHNARCAIRRIPLCHDGRNCRL